MSFIAVNMLHVELYYQQQSVGCNVDVQVWWNIVCTESGQHKSCSNY